MQNPTTWRELLGKIISDATERQRIADALGVSPITLTRWATGKAMPRPTNLRHLLSVLPHYREELIEAISKEYPFFFDDDKSSVAKEDTIIPRLFYTRILSAYATVPSLLRGSTIFTLIMQQIIAHFGTSQAGIEVGLIQCVPPEKDDDKVRSLRLIETRNTPPFLPHSADTHTLFLGAESQAGTAILSGRILVIQNAEKLTSLFPNDPTLNTYTNSAVTVPIFQANHVAGCFVLSSTVPNYFTTHLTDLLHEYANLFTLAFSENEFYDLSTIELAIMPSAAIQSPLLSRFQQTVIGMMLNSMQENKPLTRSKAERLAWKQLERELLAYGSHI